MKNILELQQAKRNKKKITVVTCYDFSFAQIINDSAIDCVLIGDSAAMVMHGHETTVPITVETMALHTSAVARGAKSKFIISDLPFLSYRKGLTIAMESIGTLMCAGAHAVKLERACGQIELIEHIVQSGVPVMGHLGMTPQSFHQLGGFRTQGKNDQDAQKILDDAKRLEQAGCFSLVLECIPAALAKQITESLSIPTIGIGAGKHVDGQVLVLQDLLGMQKDFAPKFLKTYLNGFSMIQEALNAYDREVKQEIFPDEQHSQ